jgi:hypothetical protein
VRPKTIRTIALACAVLACPAGASVIVESSGNSEASVPLGYYAPYNTATVYAVSWSQDSTFTGVSLFANLFSPGGGSADYTLTTAIGPGTSFAADGVAEGSVDTPANPANVELLQLPELGPGTYYLVLDSTNAAWQYNFPFQSNYTTASGVTYLGSQQAQFTDIDNAYAPGSSFSPIGYPVEFEVTGTSTAPEPRFDAAIGLLFVGAAVLLRKYRARKFRSL